VRRTAFLLACLLSIVWMSVVIAEEALHADLSGKRILLLYAYHPSFPTSPKVKDGIRSVFGRKMPVIDMEYMDSKRLYDAASRENFLAMLRYKLSHREPYDLVMTADDNALDFMLEHGAELFPDVPTVFLGVNNIEKALQLNRNPLFTGVVEASSFGETIALALALQPARNRLHVVVDGTTSGQADLHSILGLAEHFSGALFKVVSLQELTWADYMLRLQQLGDKDALLLLSAYRDRDQVHKSFRESLALTAGHAKVPIYHFWEHGLGDGVLGGILVSHHEQGRQAGQMAQRILEGEPASAIPVLAQSPNLPIFDSRQLQRFGIPASLLPAESVIRFQQSTAWQTYRYPLLGLALVVILLSLLSFYLGRQNLQRARMASVLAEKSSFLRLLMDTIPDPIWMKNPAGRYLSCNRRFSEMCGADEREIVGRTDFDFVDAELAKFFLENDRQAMAEGKPRMNEEQVRFASDGRLTLLETIKTPVISARGEILGVLGIARDITERRTAEEQIRTLSQTVDQSPVSVMITDCDGHIEYVNDAFERVTGYRHDEVIGRNPRFLKSDRTPSEIHEALWLSLTNGQQWEGELQNRRKNGELFWEYAHISPLFREDGTISRYLAVKEDITVRKLQHEKIVHQANFDGLTSLPNRRLCLDRLQQLLLQSRRQQTKTAVMFIDLDDFKKVNDSLGHDAGDRLLVDVASRLARNIRGSDTVGRLGGDEFIVLMGGITEIGNVAVAAAHLIEQIQRPYLVGARELMVSASIGIALSPDDGEESNDLLRKADAAMYHAKRLGRANFAFFVDQLTTEISRRFAIEEQLHSALARGEFHLVYQPQVEIDTQRIIGAAALLRWNNPTLGSLSPDEFIPIAEQTGAIVSIGRFVIETALADTATWFLDKEIPFTLAINLSPRQFRDEKLADSILELLQLAAMPAERLELEITEGLFIDQFPDVDRIVYQLHSAGISLAMDDFGTGYSSLSYLRRYPFDTLKIDREFTRDICKDSADRELVFAAIAMAHGLGLTVVAEGVEDSEQCELLRQQGCEIAQGYHFGRPVPIETFAAAMANDRTLSVDSHGLIAETASPPKRFSS
jgi:diguanylate cyclase (GGDEF)-like protein/PAS domain S-box-containing protein